MYLAFVRTQCVCVVRNFGVHFLVDESYFVEREIVVTLFCDLDVSPVSPRGLVYSLIN